MLRTATHSAPAQRIAHRIMLVMCSVLAIGVLVMATSHAVYAAPPSVRLVDDLPLNNNATSKIKKISPVNDRLGAERLSDRLVTAGKRIEVTPRPASLATPVLTADPAPKARVIMMEVTAYCPCKKCCGKRARGLTASGKHISYRGGKFVAADTSVLPFWTRISIPGYHGGRPVEVIDRGGDIKGHRLDVFYKTHAEAEEWGRRWVSVTVLD